jgi:hypothetical protein
MKITSPEVLKRCMMGAWLKTTIVCGGKFRISFCVTRIFKLVKHSCHYENYQFYCLIKTLT